MNFGAYKEFIIKYQDIQDIKKYQIEKNHITWKLVILETVLT